MTIIHPTAIIEKGANIGNNVNIGPYCFVGADVTLHNDVKLHSHVVITGHTTIHEHTEIFPFSSIGHKPQDLKYQGEQSKVIIGSHTQIREYVTIQPGTRLGEMVTKVGSHCLLMASSHVAHDCLVGDNVILANVATLAGHVQVEEFAIIGGLSAVHQRVRIGEHSIIGGMSGVESDVIPFGQVIGNRANLMGLNLVGLKRRNFSKEDIHTLRTAYRLLFSNEGVLSDRIQDAEEQYKDHPYVMKIINFMKAASERSLCLPKNGE